MNEKKKEENASQSNKWERVKNSILHEAKVHKLGYKENKL